MNIYVYVVLLFEILFRIKITDMHCAKCSTLQEFDADKAIASMMAGSRWPRSEYMVGSRPMTAAEIKKKWAANADAASRAGTWTHMQCECVLNGGAVKGECVEMRLLARFLGNTRPLLAFRTEWCIWATDEKVAGCIDFAALDADGKLVSFGCID